jgi:MYXO-CTERM domain-containing protein
VNAAPTPPSDAGTTTPDSGSSSSSGSIPGATPPTGGSSDSGCSCRTTSPGPGGAAGALPLLGLALLALRRRRR